MKSYNFFRKTFFLFSLDYIFTKSKFVFFSSINILNAAYWVKIKKFFSLFGVKFCFCNKLILKKKCFTLSRFLNSFDFFKSNLLIIYCLNADFKILLANSFFDNEFFELVLCSFLYKRFMFFKQVKLLLKKNFTYLIFELLFYLNFFVCKTLASLFIYNRLLP